jgi:hypothetical protein
MAQEEEREALHPANDNGPPMDLSPSSSKIDDGVLRIARLIGRQMARDAFEARTAANDNQAPGPCHDDGPCRPER